MLVPLQSVRSIGFEVGERIHYYLLLKHLSQKQVLRLNLVIFHWQEE